MSKRDLEIMIWAIMLFPNLLFTIWTNQHVWNLFMPHFFGLQSIGFIQALVLGTVIVIISHGRNGVYKQDDSLTDDDTNYLAKSLMPVTINVLTLLVSHLIYWMLI